MKELPAPVVPDDCDLRDQPWFPFYVDKLSGSRWWRKASHVARSINVDLWVASWSEIPAATLPDDDAELAILAGFGRGAAGVEEWIKVRDEVLEPWRRTSGGRLEHPTLSEVALECWERKLERNVEREADAERKRLARAAKAEQRSKGKGKRAASAKQQKTSERRPADVRSITDTDTDTDTDTSNDHGEAKPLPDRKAAFALWNERLPSILAECPRIDSTSPGIRNFAPLIALQAEGCDPELDIVPALVAVAQGWSGRRNIFSWNLDAFAEVAHANLETRRNGRNGNANGTPRTHGQGARGLAGAVMRRKARVENGGDDARANDGRPSDPFKAKFGDGDDEDARTPETGVRQ